MKESKKENLQFANDDGLMERRSFIGLAAAGFAALALPALASGKVIDDTSQEERLMDISIQRVGSRPSITGPADWFTGSVRIDSLFEAKEPSRIGGALVTFEPGARTAWHTHPVGQHLLITSGLGWVQREGGPKEEVRPGDVVWFPPGVKHWHGASSQSAMVHIALQESVDGSPVTWMEHVSEEHYHQ